MYIINIIYIYINSTSKGHQKPCPTVTHISEFTKPHKKATAETTVSAICKKKTSKFKPTLFTR